MKHVWSWVFAVVIACLILALVAFGRSERRAYWSARTVVVRIAQQAPASPRALHPETRLWRGR